MLIWLILSVWYPSLVRADDQAYSWTVFRQEDGLAHNVVTAVMQAPDGAMWFATFGGVSRYDGRRWQTFTSADGLPGNMVMDLAVGRGDTIWAAIAGGFPGDIKQALARYADGQWQGIDTPRDFFGRFGVQHIIALEESAACLVTDDGRLLHFDGQNLRLMQRADGSMLRGAQCVLAHQNGQIWVAQGRGQRSVFRFGAGGSRRRSQGMGIGRLDIARGVWEPLPEFDDAFDHDILAMAQDDDGGLWFGLDDGGLRHFSNGTWRTFTTEDGLPSNRVHLIQPGRNGSLWVGTPAGAAILHDDGRWRVHSERDGLPNNYVSAICLAEDGSVWVGTRGGVARFGSAGWEHHLNWPGKSDRGPTALVRDATGRLWAGTHEGLYRFEMDAWQKVFGFGGTRTRLVDLVVDGQGVLWGVEGSRVLRFDGQKWRILDSGLTSRGGFRAIAGARSGGLWLLDRSNLYRFDGARLDMQADIDRALALYEAADGALWMGMLDGGVMRLLDGQQRSFSVDDGLPDGPVNHVVADRSGRIWISTPFEGVAFYDSRQAQKGWTRVPGETDTQFNGVRRIFPADDGTLWLTSPIDGAIHTDGAVWTRYTVREGLPSSQVWDACQDAHGRLWFATSEGLACYTPDRDPPQTHLLNSPIKIAPYQSAVFEFAGQDVWKLSPQWTLQYSWRLDGGAWTPFARKTRVSLDDLSAGTHRFDVRAMDLAFNVEPEPAAHVFEVLAPVWMRPWFVALSLISGLALVLTSGYAWQRHRRWRAAQTQLIEDLESELQEAHDMQMGLLPREPLREGAFEIAGRCRPANHVGGDYFTYFWLDDGHETLGFGAADVSGKAMQAAVRAMQLSGIFRYEFQSARPPGDVLRDLHAVLLEHLDAATFITCCLGTLRLSTGQVSLGNAAHPFPYHFSAATGELNMLALTSVPLGMVLPPGVDTDPEEAEVILAPGDALVLYSDGVTDMRNAAGDFYEEDRLEALIAQHASGGAEALIDAVFDDLRRFKGQAPQADDITLLVIRRSA